MDKQYVLVTGANGFIGRILCKYLLERGFSVRALVHTHSKYIQTLFPNGDVVIGDIRDKSILKEICVDVKTIYHLAAYTHVNNVSTQRIQEINTDSTTNLLNHAISAKVNNFVFFSSSLATTAENTENRPTPYGKSKLTSEKILMNASQQGNIDVCCLRPVSVYGAGMKGNVLTLIKLIKRGWLPSLRKFNAQISLVGVNDLCEAAILAGNSPNSEGETYLVTDGINYSIRDIDSLIRNSLNLLSSALYLPKPVFFLASVFMEFVSKLFRLKNAIGYRSYRSLTRNNVYSNSKIRKELGYNPQQSLGDVLPEIISELKT